MSVEVADFQDSSGVMSRQAALPRVLQVLRLEPGKKFGSLEEQTVQLSRVFAARGGSFVPLFVADAGASLSDFKDRNVEAIVLDLKTFTLAGLLALNRVVRRQRIDIVNWNFCGPITNPYLWGLSLSAPRLRHWFTDHNSRLSIKDLPELGLRHAIKRTLLRRYEKIICVSDFVRDCLRREAMWPELVAIPHFINTERFSPNGVRKQQIRKAEGVGDDIVILSVGQLIPEKGMDVVIGALASLPRQAVLWIVGSGPEGAHLQAVAKGRGLSDRIKFFESQPDVAPMMQASDIFVCASIWHEAAGLVNIEAQACGLPVVASRIGGIPEYVRHGETGLLVEPGNTEHLTAALAKLIADQGLREKMGIAARLRAVREFSSDVGIPGVISVYSADAKREERVQC